MRGPDIRRRASGAVGGGRAHDEGASLAENASLKTAAPCLRARGADRLSSCARSGSATPLFFAKGNRHQPHARRNGRPLAKTYRGPDRARRTRLGRADRDGHGRHHQGRDRPPHPRRGLTENQPRPRRWPPACWSVLTRRGASNWPRRPPPTALAITRETLAPLDAKGARDAGWRC